MTKRSHYSYILILLIITALFSPFIRAANAAVQLQPTGLGPQNDVTKVPDTLLKKPVTGNNKGTLVQPDKAHAQAALIPVLTSLPSLYYMFRSAKEIAENTINVSTWTTETILPLLLNIPLVATVGEECKADSLQQGTCKVSGNKFFEVNGVTYSKQAGGLASVLNDINNKIYTDTPIPGDLAFYVNDVMKDNLIGVPTPAYAQLTRPGPLFEQGVFAIWKASRNIAIGVVALMLGISALAVMFRQRIGAQTVVSIYSILPYVPVVIFLILFSYPIMVIAMNFGVRGWNLGGKIAADLGSGVIGEVWTEAGASAMSDAISNAVLAVAGLGSALPAVWISLVIMVLMILGIVFAIIFYFIQFLKTYVNIVKYTVFMPIVMVSALMPGKQGTIVYFLKKILVEMITLPVIIFMAFVGIAFFISIQLTDLQFQANFTGVNYITILVKYSIGWSFIWGTKNVHKAIEGFFGVSDSMFGPAPAGKR